MTPRIRILLAALALVFSACRPAQPSAHSPTPGNAMTTSAVPATPWKLTFHDGAANGYHFSREGSAPARFEYVPVTPAMSSTGTYSGGDPASGELSDADAAELWTRVTALEADRAIHVADRNKGTGAFRIEASGASRSFIVDMGPELEAFAAYVAGFRS